MVGKFASFVVFGLFFVLVGCQGTYLDDMREDNIEQEHTGVK